MQAPLDPQESLNQALIRISRPRPAMSHIMRSRDSNRANGTNTKFMDPASPPSPLTDIDISGDPAFDSPEQRKERNKRFPGWRDELPWRPPTTPLPEELERRKTEAARETWVKDGHSGVDCGHGAVGGTFETEDYYPVPYDCDEFLSKLLHELHEKRPAQTKEAIGKFLSEFFDPIHILIATLEGPEGVLILALIIAIGKILENSAEEDQEEALAIACKGFEESSKSWLCSFLCRKAQVPHDDICNDRFCYRGSYGICLPSNLKCIDCGPVLGSFIEDDGLRTDPFTTHGGKGIIPDGWWIHLSRGWSKYFITWEGECACDFH